ncbi:hypothetical protein [Thalassobacillus devorans]|nr:hypothetical protein [Thalassobacillus devorans]
MGEFLFTLSYGGSLVLMAFFVKWMLRRTQTKDSSKINEEEEII